MNDSVDQVFNTPDTTAEYDAADIEQNKVMGILSYIFILWLVPLLAAPQSKFARVHANQGLVLFLADLVCGVIGFVLNLIPLVGGILGWLLGVVILVLMILGIVNAATGKAKELPLIGKIKLIA